MTTGRLLSGTTSPTRAATSAGGSSVAPFRWPARHSCGSRVSSSAAPLSISLCASSGRTSRTGLALISRALPCNAVLDRLAQGFERKHRALHSGRADLDAQVVEHVFAPELRDLGQRLALDLVGQHARRRLADRTAAAGERYVLDCPVFTD